MRYVAEFRPQASQGDSVYGVEPHGETKWDATAWVRRLSAPELEQALEPDTYSSDNLRFDPNAPDWAREWDGPFYITLEEVNQTERFVAHGLLALADLALLSRTPFGDECPLCHCGTVEIVGEIVDSGRAVINRETRCMGECGGVAKTDPSIPAGPGYVLAASSSPLDRTLASELGGEGFTVADMLTVRNLVRTFEKHLEAEAHKLGVSVSDLCPCAGDEVKAARELLFRLDPLMEV